MRNWIAALVIATVAGSLCAQPAPAPPPRYTIPSEIDIYPQDSPKQALASMAKAFDRKRVEYLLAHLVEPAFVDAKFPQYYRAKYGKLPEDDRELPPAQQAERIKATLETFVAEVNEHLAAHPKQALRLSRLLREGAVEEQGTGAKVTLKDAPESVLTLRQIDGRWFMINDMEGEKPKK